jgi:hypothetical protein
MRLRDKVAIVMGAGQTPGDTIGNGRATAILFAERARGAFRFRPMLRAKKIAGLLQSAQAPTPSPSRFGNTLQTFCIRAMVRLRASARSVSPVMREQRLMNTPMAIEGISKRRGISKDELIRERDACAG